MTFSLDTVLLCAALFVSMVTLGYLGRSLGVKHRRDNADAEPGTGAVDAAVFGLLGLLVAFTFSGAAGRLESRTKLVVEETNAISTAYSRIDLLPPQLQPALRQAFRSYVDARIAIYASIGDRARAQVALADSRAKQDVIWKLAIAATHASNDTSLKVVLLPPINEMFDISETRVLALHVHPPHLIFGLLCALALICSLHAGFSMSAQKRQSRLHMVGFAAVCAITVYVVLELEYPRIGFLHFDMADRMLVEARQRLL